MPTVTSLARAIGGAGNPSPKPYMVDVYIDLAAAATANGTALVASDVIRAITVDGPTIVLAAGMETTTTPAGGTGTTLDLGITGDDADCFVDGFVFDSSTAGSYANMAGNGPKMIGADDTIDVLIQAASTVSTSGVVRVFAVLMQADAEHAARSANEVVRDQLA